jgi:hypothetical protein
MRWIISNNAYLTGLKVQLLLLEIYFFQNEAGFVNLIVMHNV